MEIDKVKYLKYHYENFLKINLPIFLQQKIPDENFSRHLFSVEKYTTLILRERGFTEKNEFFYLLKIAALAHDIGKIKCDPKIIAKKEKLTPEEFEQVKKHPKDGYDYIKKEQPELNYRIVLNGVLYHHENWDGSGYPYRAKAHEIPFEARILRIADSVAAMNGFRPYEETKNLERIIGELIELRNKWYDPELVDVSVRAFEKNSKLFSIPK